MNFRTVGLLAVVTLFACKSAEKKCAEDKDTKACQSACDAGKTKSCAKLADMKLFGKGTAKDGAGAYELYKKACKADDHYACARTAYMMGRPGGPKYNNDKYIEIAKDACKQEEQLGCALWANAIHFGTEDEKTKAESLAKKACEADVVEGCVLGAQWSLDKKEKTSKSLKTLEEACDGGNTLGCFYLSLTLIYGSGGVEKDGEKAEGINKKYCEEDEPLFCSLLSTQYEKGYGVKASPKKAYDAAKKACKLMDDEDHSYCKTAKTLKAGAGDDE